MPGLQDLAVRLSELLDIPESEALRITSQFIPVITLESIVGLPSTRVPGLVGAPALGTNFRGAAAGVDSHVQLFNPPNSGVLVFLDSTIISIGTSGSIHVRRHDAPLANEQTTKSYRDFRRNGAPVAQLRDENNAAAQGTQIGGYEGSATDPFQIDFETLVLGEGQGVLFVPTNVNISMEGFYFWREV